MLTNLMTPWLLARLLCGVAATLLVLYAAAVGWRVLRHFRVTALSEGQLALERRAELAAAVVQTGLFIAVAGLFLTVLAADRMSGSIRGAMCAYGVLHSTGWGFVSLAVSAATAAGCALWIVLHRLDLRMATPSLTRRKFAGLLLLAPLVVLDLGASTAHALSLDLGVVASCCAASLDAAPAAVAGAGPGPGALSFYIGLGVAAAALGAALWTRRRPGAPAALSAAALSIVACAALVPAVLWYVAPHAYGTPVHTCPFCLLRGEAGGLGWPLFAALFSATVLGAGLGLVEASRRASGEPAEVSAMERVLGRYAALAWAVCIALCAAPVVRYAIVTGGASLFGT